ncbi:hypothetical protein F503_05110 [Ophiostoma piceae UAMH 11346]|uniref:Uncharacterized protein n=1 Tax=Ophiostoma piceae (strain UAMH 11346) TaxID=1262450 RepID=S3D944_OPHP1|nr:hypothetical protein F503_05110 [Ophiostoma piceae UAMH 11346]
MQGGSRSQGAVTQRIHRLFGQRGSEAACSSEAERRRGLRALGQVDAAADVVRCKVSRSGQDVKMHAAVLYYGPYRQYGRGWRLESGVEQEGDIALQDS